MQSQSTSLSNARNFLKAKHTYKTNTPIQYAMRQQLLFLLQYYTRMNFDRIFEFGCGQGEFTQILESNLAFQEYICNDINDYGLHFDNKKIQIQIFDMEKLTLQDIFHQKFDLIASNACLQWLDFDKTLDSLYHMLHTNAIVLLSTFGTQNLREIREITGFGLEYLSLEQMRKKWEIFFETLGLQESFFTLHFNSAVEVFKHLQKSGVNSLSSTSFKRQWLEQYEQRFHNNLTYHTICFIAQKKS